MPSYDFQCTSCGIVEEKRLKFAEYDVYKASNPSCEACEDGTLERVILSAPAMDLPANMSYDGKGKFLGAGQTEHHGNKQARIPINIIDEKPDGSYKVTRIGRKQDIDNE